MARILTGKEVAKQILDNALDKINKMTLIPRLAILRVGEKANDISYENSAIKKAKTMNVEVVSLVLSEDTSQKDIVKNIEQLNVDPKINGILVLRPIGNGIDDNIIRNAISPAKDVDGTSDTSLGSLFVNNKQGFIPCTAQAVEQILEYYKIPIQGKKVAIIGRSLTVGKPLAMLLLNKNASIFLLHSKSEDIKQITKKADIVVCASGLMEYYDASYFTNYQTVIDVGLNFNETKGKICGDVFFEDVAPFVKNISPVPAGVGSITSTILMSHVIEACIMQNQFNK